VPDVETKVMLDRAEGCLNQSFQEGGEVRTRLIAEGQAWALCALASAVQELARKP